MVNVLLINKIYLYINRKLIFLILKSWYYLCASESCPDKKIRSQGVLDMKKLTALLFAFALIISFLSPLSTQAQSGDTGPNPFIKQVPQLLEKYGLTLDQFQTLKNTPTESYSDKDVEIVKNIREQVPQIDTDTKLVKVMTVEDAYKYYKDQKSPTIRGFIAKFDDIGYVTSYDDIRETLRLDYSYVDPKTGQKVEPFPAGGTSYAKIVFKTPNANQIGIPFNPRFGGTEKSDPPFTGNGFTGARNNTLTPEFKFSNPGKPSEGEIYVHESGQDVKVATYDADLDQFIFDTNN